MTQRKSQLPIVNPHAAGIDIGSKEHFVAIGQQPEDIARFGCYTSDLLRLSSWLKVNGITTVAMESTGSYWKGLFQQLQQDGFEVLLVNGKHTRNVKGRKTDVVDCQWIQRLHSLGLLSGSFLPDEATAVVRQYVRQRDHLIEQAAVYVKKMQQCLRQMNIRLDVAIRDIVGKSGTAIVHAILQGERDPYILASLCNRGVKKSKDEIVLSLQGNWKDEYLFELRMSLDLYDNFQQKIKECDVEIEKLICEAIKQAEIHTSIDDYKNEPLEKRKKKKNKNAPNMDLRLLAQQLTGGVDLYQIEGVSHTTVLTLLSETGFDLHAFPTGKHFASWLALSPNNKISGGKILHSHVSHHNNRLAQALRRAANAIGNMKEGALNQFFKRIAYRNGRSAAITATARKLAVIIYNMLMKHQPYFYEPTPRYQERLRRLQVKNMQRKILALDIKPEELQFLAG